MPIIHKNHPDFPTDSSSVTVKGVQYQADYLIKFHIDKDLINLKNCTCVFSIYSRDNYCIRKYVGAKFYKELNNETVSENINGYLPEFVFCYTETEFPLDDFLEEQGF